MPQVHVLVDLENNQPTLEELRRRVPDLTDVWLFHSKQQVNRLASYESLGDRQTAVPISRPGKNSLDFHLAFYLGYIASRNPNAKLVVVAIDGGYEPMIEHARSLDFNVSRVRPVPAANTVKKVPAKSMATKSAVGKAAAPATTANAGKKKPKVVKSPVAAKKKVSASKGSPPVAKKKAQTKAAKLPSMKKPARAAATSKAPRKDRFASIVKRLSAHIKGRPRKRSALEGFVRTALGPSSTDSEVGSMVERLVNAEVIRLDGTAVIYPANVALTGAAC